MRAHTTAFAFLLGATGCNPGDQSLVDADVPDSPDADVTIDMPDAAIPDAMPGTCTDGIQTDAETDVDCGGGTCPQCVAGKRCAVASDCVTGSCGEAGRCSLGTVSFADAVSHAASFKPYVMMAADLDGDGDIDLAVANEEGNTISLFRNVGHSSGMFVPVDASTRDGFPTGEYPTGGAIADFNHDGIPDVITANYHGNSVSILLGAGTGAAYTLGAPASYPTVAGAETSNLAVGDLNGDGVPDVIATNPQRSSISVFVGRPDGTLAPGHTVAIGAGNAEPYSVAIGDFNGDGHADAAVADNRSATMFVLLGNGDATFHLAWPQPTIGGYGSFIVVAHDMDLDGKLDLVIADRSSDQVSVLLGRGDGTFRAPLVSSTGPGTGPYSVAIADFNLDGVPDVVTADFMTSSASVLLGRGDGRLSAPIDSGTTGFITYGIAAGDFNGDGKPDFATANAVSDDMTVKLSTAH